MNYKRISVISTVIIVSIVATVALHHAQKPAVTTPHTTAAHAKTPASSQPSGTTQPKTQTQQSTVATAPDTVACTFLDSATAQRILGDTAHYHAESSPLMDSVPSTQTTNCGYQSDTTSIRVSVRTPKGSLGTSENATAFGSERPSSAVAVTGYGQSAYWTSSDAVLNILAHNTWYAIQTSSGSQADAQTAANLLVGKL